MVHVWWCIVWRLLNDNELPFASGITEESFTRGIGHVINVLSSAYTHIHHNIAHTQHEVQLFDIIIITITCTLT